MCISVKYHSAYSSFFIGIVGRGGGDQLCQLGTAVTNWPTVPTPGDYDDGEIGEMIGRGNRSTRRKSGPVPLRPPQTPHVAQTRTRGTTVGNQRLTAWTTARSYTRPCSNYSLSSKAERENLGTYQAEGLVHQFRVRKLSRVWALLTSLGVQASNMLHFLYSRGWL
jgi:hypothetical protein